MTAYSLTVTSAREGSVVANYNVSIPATTGTVLGVSGGTIGVANAVTKYKPHIVRAFTKQDAAAVPTGIPIAYSNDGGHNRGYDLIGATVGSAGYNAWLSELTVAFNDTSVPHYMIWGHEEDIHGNDFAKLGQVYDGGRLVLNALNQNRTHKIKSVVVTTGMPFDTVAYKDWNLRSADILGVDNYARKHWDTMDAWAAQCGKPWVAPETGIQAQTDPNKYTDDQQLAAMVTDFNVYNNNALWVTYWIGGGNDLENKPKSAAKWQQLCVASPRLA